jgi:hypothetical protein
MPEKEKPQDGRSKGSNFSAEAHYDEIR